MILDGLTVVVVDERLEPRAELMGALHRLGAHVVGAHAPVAAMALLDGLQADLVVLRDAADPAVAWLRRRSLVIPLARAVGTLRAVDSVLAALGRSRSDATLN
jgi:hypothetical protein